ncbi:MAG: shikimate kinase [Arenicella sp.]
MLKTNIVLVGMPATGKSTLGYLLAERLDKTFIDTDELIEELSEQPLQQLIDQIGHDRFDQVEEKALLSIEEEHLIIATGGSAIYRRDAIAYLKQNAIVVHLMASPENLQKRIKNFDTRGIVIGDGMTFDDLYNERMPLYIEQADFTVDTDVAEATPEQIVERIMALLDDCAEFSR